MTTETLLLTAEPSSQQHDWATLYRTLETDGLVPSASEQAIEPGRARCCVMFLDLGQVQAALLRQRQRAREVLIERSVPALLLARRTCHWANAVGSK